MKLVAGLVWCQGRTYGYRSIDTNVDDLRSDYVVAILICHVVFQSEIAGRINPAFGACAKFKIKNIQSSGRHILKFLMLHTNHRSISQTLLLSILSIVGLIAKISLVALVRLYVILAVVWCVITGIRRAHNYLEMNTQKKNSFEFQNSSYFHIFGHFVNSEKKFKCIVFRQQECLQWKQWLISEHYVEWLFAFRQQYSTSWPMRHASWAWPTALTIAVCLLKQTRLLNIECEIMRADSVNKWNVCAAHNGGHFGLSLSLSLLDPPSWFIMQ